MAPGTGKGNSADFKRIKAKVGKRVKAANLTATSFRAAKVAVRPSLASKGTQGSLVSSRGKSLEDLTQNLQHPALNVRLSASKGLQDLIKRSEASKLAPHWNAIVPVLAQCCVDSGSEVRQTGILIWTIVIQVLQGSANDVLKPYRGLVVALLVSGLNSLDRSTRKHVVALVRLLAANLSDVLRPCVPQLLVSFPRLFEDFGVGNTTLLLDSLAALLLIRQASVGECNASPPLELSYNTAKPVLLTSRKVSRQSQDLLLVKFARNFSTPLRTSCNSRQSVGLEQELLNRLTNVYVEATQECMDTKLLSLLARAMRLLVANDTADFECKKIVSLIAESFPIVCEQETSSDGPDTELINGINGNLCFVLLQLGPIVGGIDWSTKTTAYVRRHLKTSPGALDIWEKLVLKQEISVSTKHQLVSALHEAFFQHSDAVERRSPIGRKAARLGIDYESKQGTAFGQKTNYNIGVALSEYVVDWGSSYPSDSEILVGFLLTMVSRSECDENVRNKVVLALQDIVQPQGSKILSRSILQEYPSSLQYKFLCLLLRAGTPPPTSVEALGRICAQNRLSRSNLEWTNFCVSSLFEIRKSISMQTFLKFLLDSTGVLLVQESMLVDSEVPSSLAVAKMLELDDGVMLATSCLKAAGNPSKVLAMISPFLKKMFSWSHGTTNIEQLQIRAALSILACFTLENSNASSRLSSALPSSIKELAAKAVCILLCASEESDDTDFSPAHPNWFQPLKILLAHETEFLFDVLTSATSFVNNADTKSREVKQMLLGLLYVLRDSRVTVVVEQNSDNFTNHVQLLHEVLSDQHLSSIIGRISDVVQYQRHCI